MFRSYNHVGSTEERIGAGSVNTKFFVVAGEGEIDLGTCGTSDPVALHLLDPFRPVEAVEPFQQTFGVMGNAEHPLFQEAAFYLFGTAFFVRAIIQHLLVGTDCFAGPTVPDLCFTVVGKAFLVDIFLDSLFTSTCNFCRNGKFADKFSLAGSCIKPGVVQFGEDPLGPFEIGGIGGIDFAVPIVAQSEGLNLASEIVAVFLGRFGRMSTGLNGILFGRQSEGIPTHGVKHIEAFAAFVTANDVGGGITFGMTNVQSGPGWVREHIQTVKFGFGKIVCRLETLVVGPELLPPGFDLFEVIIHRCELFVLKMCGKITIKIPKKRKSQTRDEI